MDTSILKLKEAEGRMKPLAVNDTMMTDKELLLNCYNENLSNSKDFMLAQELSIEWNGLQTANPDSEEKDHKSWCDEMMDENLNIELQKKEVIANLDQLKCYKEVEDERMRLKKDRELAEAINELEKRGTRRSKIDRMSQEYLKEDVERVKGFQFNFADFKIDVPSPKVQIDGFKECLICHKCSSVCEVAIFDCDHNVCTPCLKNLISKTVRDQKLPLFCPQLHCLKKANESAILHLTDDPFVAQRFCEIYKRRNSKNDTFFCPNKSCMALVLMPKRDCGFWEIASCPRCECLLCLKCQTLWHDGRICDGTEAEVSSGDEETKDG